MRRREEGERGRRDGDQGKSRKGEVKREEETKKGENGKGKALIDMYMKYQH